MRIFWKIAPWILLALVLIPVLVLIGVHEIPREMEVACEGLLIRGDGTQEMVQIRMQGSWKPEWLAQNRRTFSGSIWLEGVLEEQPLAVAFEPDPWNGKLLMGGSSLRQGNLRIIMDTDMAQGIFLVTNPEADSYDWVVLNVTTMEQANALRREWNLPELEFGWE